MVTAPLRALFLDALALDDAARQEFLHSRCANHDVRQQIARLLAASEGASDYCDQLAQRLSPARSLETAVSMPTQVGVYRPIRLLGQGGMGSVFLAERSDQQFEKQVAIKLLPSSVDRVTAARFVKERQILARLVHPNITRLLDGGLTEDQRPYFVMDYIDGLPIDAYCDQNKLTIDQRLKLFFQVCSAVQYAHTSLVLHRDLKPSNILVTNDGNVQLLDFGVSELLVGDVDATGDWRTPLTPTYASPELIRNEVATTASDVYSMGILLYRLITGLHPFSDGDDELSTLLQRIVEQHPPTITERWLNNLAVRPDQSQRIADDRSTSVSTLSRQIAGDLSPIVATAISNNLEHRYQTVAELADDLDALREQRPVRVVPATLSYRATRFFQRYTLASTLALLSLVLMLAMVVLSTRFAIESQRQTAVVASERDRAQSVSQFLLSLFVQANPRHNPNGTSITAKELLDIGVERIHRLQSQPETQAALLSLAANAYSHMDLLEQARPLFNEALRLQRQQPSTSARSLSNTLTRLARVEADLGHWVEAERHAIEALTLLRSSAKTAAHSIGLSRGLLLLGSMRLTQGDFAGSADYLNEALQVAAGADNPNQQVLMARILSHLGSVALERNQAEQSQVLHQRALKIRREISHRETIDHADSYLKLGQTRHSLGQLDAAEQSYQRAAEIHQRLLSSDSVATATTARLLGELRISQGQPDQAKEALSSAVAIWRRIGLLNQPELASSLASLAQLHLAHGELTKARELMTESVAIGERIQPDHWRTAERKAILETLR